MKKIAPFLFGFVFMFYTVSAQHAVLAPDWVGFVFSPGPPDQLFKFVGKPVDIELKLKNEFGNTVYLEHFSKTVGEGGYVNANFGLGTIDPNYVDNYFEAFDQSLTICSTVTVHDDTGDYSAMGTSLLSSGPYALFAQKANDSKALGGIPFTENYFEGGFLVQETDNFDLPIIQKTGTPPNEEKKFVRTHLSDFVKKNEAPTTLNGNIRAYVNLGTGEPFPIALTKMQLTELRSYFTVCPADMDDFEYGVEIKMPLTATRSLVHATAAIYAENIKSESAVGLFANATARGVYSQGQTGVLGITNGTGNGAATWSRVGSAPAAGGFKYGIFAEDQGLTGSWAAGIFGNGFYTGTWSQSSDARLKTEIRSQTDALNTILKVRPAQYRYSETTPYNLPKGIHYGFIAQEMETVLPELVSDITMPKDMDPNRMPNSGTETYKAINYIEMISILTAALQELNAKVDTQNEELVRLGKELQACSKSK